MKHRRTLILRITAAAIVIACLYLFAPWQAALYYLSPRPLTVQAQLDEAVDRGLAGIILYAQRAGQPGGLYAAGWHDRALKIPAYPNALFKIGSIGKLYDAAAVAKLAASGRLSLDSTLADYLPSLEGRVEYADRITVRMMVQHRSGIPSYTDQPGFSWGGALNTDANLALALDRPADFEPGTDYGYSNTNYLLLKRIMTKVLGYEHGRFIKEQMLAPLGLKRTYFSRDEIDTAELMSGYHIDYDTDFKGLDQGYISSAEDVGLFLRALNDGSLFANDHEREMYASLYEVGHTGWVLGYSSIARYHKEMDTVVVQFVNTNGNDALLMQTEIIYGRILEILKAETERATDP
jgi:CubicO group peptidase (beta-lactamase class C family)